MAKEIYISTTPHETRLAIVEDEQLAEIYYERENEYTLAGSIYNGRVTRVLPGMQSSFVDIGLERDAFLYVTDFMEEQGDAADFDAGPRKAQAPRENGREEGRQEGRSDSRERRGRDRGRNRQAAEPTADTQSFDEPVAPHPVEESSVDEVSQENPLEAQGSRRWRGRRGRRRGRGMREMEPQAQEQASPASDDSETFVLEGSSEEPDFTSADETEATAESSEPEPNLDYARARDSRREEIRRGRNRMRGLGDSSDRAVYAPVETAPIESAYASQPAPSGSVPFTLPGESIRKYRDPEEVAQEDTERAASAPVPVQAVLPPATSFEVVGWDGGAVLPGETLSRHRSRQPQAAEPAGSATSEVKNQQAEAVAEQPAETIEASQAEVAVETAAPEQPHFAASQEDADSSPVAESAPSEITVAAIEAEIEPPSAGEYEPGEGESATLGDVTRRDLRRLEQRPETSSEAKPEEPSSQEPSASESEVESQAAQPDATTYDLHTPEPEPAAATETEPAIGKSAANHAEGQEHTFTTLQASGEMLSEVSSDPAETFQHVPPAQDHEQVLDPVTHEGAVQSVTLEHAEFTPTPAPESDDAEASSSEALGQVHAYGDGDLHEEELDGDEYEYDLALAAVEEEEFDEYEEETLNEDADMGAMLHEMAADENAVSAEGDSGDEEESFNAGGFTVEDFGGEPEDEDTSEPGATTAYPQEDRRQRRDSRRPGGRDRRQGGGFRGGAGGGERRGRGRQSVQTMDLPAINELLKPGQEILVQIAKEPIAKKGARITSHIALPGRFLVFMPTVNHTGVSRKISSDEERRRLKSILLSEKGEAQGGFIVRTAAEGASEEELRNDLRFLIQLWQDIKMRSESSKSPALIYHDLSLIERILRDQVTDNFSAIWVDSEGEYERVLRFLQRFQPSLVRRVKLYTKETPLFEHFGVTQEIDKALKSKVWLKSGGSIVINQTEALVAIDINTGKYVGKTARLEDTILKTNLDAIPEIVRQIRLRDLGGIIVIDFIDMDERKNRAKVMQVLEDELKSDRAPSKVLPFNDFGLVIMTRKRVKQSLERTLCIPDPVTEGTGMIKSPITVANEIYIEMRKMYRHIEKSDVMLRVHPEVVKQLKAAGGKRLQELEEMTHKTILVKSDPALSPEQFDIH